MAPPVPAPEPAPVPDDALRLLGVVLALVSMGMLMVWSTTVYEAMRPRSEAFGDPLFYLRRQVQWAILGSIALAIAWTTDLRALLHRRFLLLGVIAAVLVVVLLTPAVNGAHRWFRVGGFNAQPSEVAKLVAILFLVGHCSDRARLETLRGAVLGFGALGLIAGLVAVEPDLGTAAVISATGAVILLVAGVRLAHAALLALPGVALVAVYAAARFQHVKTRISVFMDPDADPMGKGYQIRQALIALGSGGPTGLGLGSSKQKLFFLPEDHTDFILAILGEELGLIGTVAVVALFGAFVCFGIRIALGARSREGFLLAIGLTTLVGLQAAMNVAVVTASMPTKGISLPFVSFGGSSLLFAMTGVGMLLGVATESARVEVASAA